MSVRIRIDLGYQGTHFHGWAAQPNLRTVQGELERALAQIVSEPVRTVVAGRTDAGVHARRQVVHCDLTASQVQTVVGQTRAGKKPREVGEALASRLRGVLGHYQADDVVIHQAQSVHADFDARFSALWRAYTYYVADAAAFHDPLTRDWTAVHRGTLDVVAMDRAIARMVGLHNFLAFCKPRPDSTTIRTLEAARVSRRASGLIEVYVRADAFCHHMVRATVGALLKVGAGVWEESKPAQLLAAVDGRAPMFVAPAKGLVLEEIGYPPPGQWKFRNQQTRAMREKSE